MVKKAEDVPVSGPGKVICPACRSEVSSDGAKLFSRSKRLEDLEEAAEVSGKIGTEVEKLETELTTLREENKKLKAVVVAAEKKREKDADPDDELR